ncbi:peptide/nickel transport system substrate-binding protein [Rhodoligotrophos appendicifer]|uniref:ABC transporter substrate-binding protein n=1 Tax=Rhodoligotrophos appendicifer TaxID=987056 RepID=UPI0019613853|nr:ABC transporter substrate-binding protein [Rhodoligotrophos appendicifer]
MLHRFITVLATLIFVGLSPALAENDQVLDVVAPFEIKGTDPSLSGDIFLKMGIVETLVDADRDGNPTPALAESWERSEDATVWRFKLRPGVRFHDGSMLSADSVVKSLTVARSKPGILDKAPITRIEADGDDVVIRLSKPFAPLLAFLAENRAQILSLGSFSATDEVTSVIGTGAYRLTSLQAPQKLTTEVFPDYWGDKPVIGGTTYLAVGRAETRALMAESGDADYVLNLDPASRTRLAASDKVDVLAVSIPRSVLLKVNAGHPFLDDVKARQALSLAIDREGIAAAILRYPAAADQLFPPSVGTWHNASIAPLAHDVEKAKALLAELGWKPGADAVLERDGKRFSLTLTTYPDRPELPLIAAVLQEQFREIGVEVTINSTNSSEIPAKHQDGSLEIGLVARNFALAPDPIATVLQDYPPKGGDWGAMNWSNPEFETLIAALATASSTEDGQTLRDKAVAILQDELPVIPIAWYQQTAGVSKSVKGAAIDPFERSFGISKMRWAE